MVRGKKVPIPLNGMCVYVCVRASWCVMTVIIVGDMLLYTLFYPAFKPDLDSGPTVV